jgi:hypothetical protein
LLNFVSLAPVPRLLGVGDMGSSFGEDGLRESKVTSNILEGICGGGIAETIFNAWETVKATLVAGRCWDFRRQPQFNIFGVIGEEDGVDFVEKVADARHVEPLRDPEGVNVFGKGTAAYTE